MAELLTIAICDDNKYIHTIMKRYIEDYAAQHGITCEVISFDSGKELIEKKPIPVFDMLFLDIEMPELDGIETARSLNKRGAGYKIIILSGCVERFKDAFKIGAFRFVTKPIEKEEIFEVIEDVRSSRIGYKKLQLYRNGKSYTVFQKDIFYIMVDKTSTYIYTKKFEFRSEKTLAWWEQELDTRLFFRCHKTCIVNMGTIDQIKKDIILYSGERVLVSRRRQTELEKRLIEYNLNYR